jgi:prevent-host-death family protein
MQTNVSSLKQHLSENLLRVKNGETITILERKTPIARIVPIKKSQKHRLSIRKPTARFVDLKLKIRLKVDPADYIAAGREDR